MDIFAMKLLYIQEHKMNSIKAITCPTFIPSPLSQLKVASDFEK